MLPLVLTGNLSVMLALGESINGDISGEELL